MVGKNLITKLLNKLGLCTREQFNRSEQHYFKHVERITRESNQEYRELSHKLAKEMDKTNSQKQYIQQLKQERIELKQALSDVIAEKNRFRNRAKLADRDKSRLHRIMDQRAKEQEQLDKHYTKNVADLTLELLEEKSKHMAYVAMYDALNNRYQRLACMLALPYAMREQALVAYQRTYLETLDAFSYERE